MKYETEGMVADRHGDEGRRSFTLFVSKELVGFVRLCYYIFDHKAITIT